MELRTEENVDRIPHVLDTIDAVYRLQPDGRLRPTARRSCPAATETITKYGALDILGMIGENQSYEDLLPNTHEILIGEGISVRILNLETLIQLKEQLNGEKDRAMLPTLRNTLKSRP